MVALKSSPEPVSTPPATRERKSRSAASWQEWLVLLALFLIVFLLYQWIVTPWVNAYLSDSLWEHFLHDFSTDKGNFNRYFPY